MTGLPKLMLGCTLRCERFGPKSCGGKAQTQLNSNKNETLMCEKLTTGTDDKA